MLFLKQKEIVGSNKGRFHLVNVCSIAGHSTAEYFGDYCASKFAFRGFINVLRQELKSDNSPVALTNFYPWYINTGMFAGVTAKF
mmetsp:Transcript_68598/g.95059  ORF Transcript_68598/g.95059 Transcript_68598/m.95059 type:complete len:85 (-) Transcript_68598:250-504(-)